MISDPVDPSLSLPPSISLCMSLISVSSLESRFAWNTAQLLCLSVSLPLCLCLFHLPHYPSCYFVYVCFCVCLNPFASVSVSYQHTYTYPHRHTHTNTHMADSGDFWASVFSSMDLFFTVYFAFEVCINAFANSDDKFRVRARACVCVCAGLGFRA